MGEETPLEKLFKSMDKDGDGTVTKEVFVITIIINIVTYYKDSDGTVTKEVRRPLLSLIENWGPLVEDFQELEKLSLLYFSGVQQHLQESDKGTGDKIK